MVCGNLDQNHNGHSCSEEDYLVKVSPISVTEQLSDDNLDRERAERMVVR